MHVLSKLVNRRGVALALTLGLTASLVSVGAASAATDVEQDGSHIGTVADGSTTYTVTTEPSHGTLTLNEDGTYLYTPNAGYSGPDSFSYSAVGFACDTDGTPTTVQSTLKLLEGASELDKTSPANLVYNGEFDLGRTASDNIFWSPLGNATDSASATGETGTMGSIDGWGASGGGTKSYGTWGATYRYFFMRDTTNHSDPNPYVYFGNEKVQMDGADGTAETYFGAGVNFSTTTPPLTAFNSAAEFGDLTTPLSISQDVTLVPGTTYRLSFFQGSERGSGTPALDGLAGLTITGYNTTYFRVHNPTHQYMFEFTAVEETTTIGFSNWGHLRLGTSLSRFSNELALDDVRINKCGTTDGTVDFNVTASADPKLPNTGGDAIVTMGIAALAGVLLAGGIAIVRRRRNA